MTIKGDVVAGMRWRKLGLVFEPGGQAPWISTHAALPWPCPRGGDAFRIFVAGRDSVGRSQVGYVDCELGIHSRVLDVARAPVLGLGALGAFDDCGVMNAAFVERKADVLMYYVGITTGKSVPFRSFTGLAIADKEMLAFERVSPAPILERNAIDPYLTAVSFVMIDEGVYRMWYTSGVRWEASERGPKHFYHIKYAWSRDGVVWERDGRACIDFRDDEYAIARPFVIKENDIYKMWYSYRGLAYRIGYAESGVGVNWERRDDIAGIAPSTSGWDAEMICYAAVFDHAGQRYMLYNGNAYGKTGFGLAILE
jgi:hypothetical protein